MPQDTVDRYHELIKKSFEEFGISFGVYGRTTSTVHHQTASDFFRKLYDKGEFIEKISMQYYDEDTKIFLTDHYITGKCPRARLWQAVRRLCRRLYRCRSRALCPRRRVRVHMGCLRLLLQQSRVNPKRSLEIWDKKTKPHKELLKTPVRLCLLYLPGITLHAGAAFLRSIPCEGEVNSYRPSV